MFTLRNPYDWRETRFDTGGAGVAPTPQDVPPQAKVGGFEPWYLPPLPEAPTFDFQPLDPPPGSIYITFDPESNTYNLNFSVPSSDPTAPNVIQSILLPAWFILQDEGGGTHKVEIQATLLNLLINGLPTSDPGFGGAWLSDS